MDLAWAGILIPATICGITDYRKYLIPNIIALPTIVTGLIYHAVSNNFTFSLMGILIGIILTLPGFLLNAMGGGDVKLAAAIGAWLGWEALWRIMFIAAVIGIVWGIFKAGKEARAKLITFFRGLWLKVVYKVPGAWKTWEQLNDNDIPKGAIPFGVPLAMAAWLYWLSTIGGVSQY